MTELFDATFSAVNIIPTTLLLFVLAYWVLVILGTLDISTFDFDLDIDADIDADLDVDADASHEVSISWLNNILSFFNIDKVPFMVFMTFWMLPVWVMSIMVNHTLGNSYFLLSILFLVPILIVGLLISKPLTAPFIRIFRALDKEDSLENLVGQMGTIMLNATTTKIGQAEVMLEGSNFRLNVKAHTGELKKGDEILVIDYKEDKNYYIVEIYNTEK